MNYTKCLLSLFLFSVSANANNINDEISTIRNNFHKIYIEDKPDDFGLMKILNNNQPGYEVGDRVIVEVQQRVPYSYGRIEHYLKNMKENGEWVDVNYHDKNRSGWEARIHAERIYELVVAFLKEGSKHHKSSKLEAAIHRAMKFWFDNKPVSLNWWYNQIGPQRTFGTAFILFQDYMSEDETNKAIEVLGASKFGMTGQNKVWLAANVMMRGVLQNDINLVKQAREEIVSEITLGNKEGIKDDWCFHQHGPQQQFGNYGLAYIYTMSLLSGVLADTSMAFNETQLGIISSLIEKGYQWIIWDGKMDINALGRQLFVSAPIHKAIGAAFAASDLGGNDQNCKNIASQFLNNCFTCDNALTGVYHFWQSDYTICRRKSWMASLKMASTRVLGTECMNGDNMKGYYMADGAMYLYKSSNEYLDIFPLWDWRKLPGITCYDDNQDMPVLKQGYYPGNNEDFVGGLTDGNNGISTLCLDRDGLTAHKTYIFEDDMILCLGSGISSDSALNVTTSIEQCWAKEDFKVLGNAKKVSNHTYKAKELKVIHNNTGYVLWNNNGTCTVAEKHSKGNINKIMKMQKDKEVEGDLFTLYINHGTAPKNESYCYAIIPETDENTLEHFKTSGIKVIENNKSVNAVWLDDKDVCWASVTKPSGINIKKHDIKFETPGLYKISIKGKKAEIMCCDPTQKQDRYSVVINNKVFSGDFPSGKLKGTSSHPTTRLSSQL